MQLILSYFYFGKGLSYERIMPLQMLCHIDNGMQQ